MFISVVFRTTNHLCLTPTTRQKRKTQLLTLTITSFLKFGRYVSNEQGNSFTRYVLGGEVMKNAQWQGRLQIEVARRATKVIHMMKREGIDEATQSRTRIKSFEIVYYQCG